MLHYSKHAQDRMSQRRITKKEVEACLNQYKVSYPTEDDDNCMNYVCTFPNERTIRVVVNEKNPNHRVVISVMD